MGMMGLPSLRALDGAQAARIWLAAEATDMRCGFDRLAERVRVVVGEDPTSGHYFLFRSRRGDRLKVLVWDRDGFVLWYKRLEAGTFKLPRIAAGVCSVELRPSELAMLLDGIDMSRLKRAPRYERSHWMHEKANKIAVGRNIVFSFTSSKMCILITPPSHDCPRTQAFWRRWCMG